MAGRGVASRSENLRSDRNNNNNNTTTKIQMPIALDSYSKHIKLEEPFLLPQPSVGQIAENLRNALRSYSVRYNFDIPQESEHQRQLLRNILTVRGASDPFPPEVDSILAAERASLRTVNSEMLPTVRESITESSFLFSDAIVLHRGDITALVVDAIANAANSALLGCFKPGHTCIDNVIHAKAGPNLRDDCAKIIELQEGNEPRGLCKVTRGYYLPARFVLHTVGPEPHGAVSLISRFISI